MLFVSTSRVIHFTTINHLVLIYLVVVVVTGGGGSINGKGGNACGDSGYSTSRKLKLARNLCPQCAL